MENWSFRLGTRMKSFFKNFIHNKAIKLNVADNRLN